MRLYLSNVKLHVCTTSCAKQTPCPAVSFAGSGSMSAYTLLYLSIQNDEDMSHHVVWALYLSTSVLHVFPSIQIGYPASQTPRSNALSNTTVRPRPLSHRMRLQEDFTRRPALRRRQHTRCRRSPHSPYRSPSLPPSIRRPIILNIIAATRKSPRRRRQ